MTSDQLRIIKQLKSKVHSKLTLEYSDFDTISPIDWLEVTENIFDLIKHDYYQSHNEFFNCIVIVISLNEEGLGKNIFNPNYIQQLDESGNLSKSNFIEIDIKGNLVDKVFNDIVYEFDELSELSQTNSNHLFFRAQSNSLFTFGKGKIISSISDINSLVPIYRFSNKIPTNEIKKILEKYKTHFGVKIPSSLYWHNKEDRKLKNKPEKLLGYFFKTFLEENISDGDVMSETIVSGADDRLDIRVLNLNNKKINIYEVKWIGRSEGGTEYLGTEADKRANDGIEQLSIYLRNEHNCENAILVLYDARFEKEIKEIDWLDEHKWNTKIYKPPFILFLKSESASKLATKITKEKFKNKKDAP